MGTSNLLLPTIVNNLRTYLIHIAEDLPRLAHLLRENIELAPAFAVTGIAANGLQLLQQLGSAATLPDVVLMDIQMPVLDGIAATAALKAKHPQIKIVIATVFDDEDNIFNAILAGADGYLLKDESPEALHRALHEVLHGGAPMSPAIARKALLLMRRTTPSPIKMDTEASLSDREVEILEQLSKGLSYGQVADNLFISTGTVRKHIEHIYRKLQVHNKITAIEEGKKRGLI